MICILQQRHVSCEEKYRFHICGLYSEELILRVEELCNLNFIDEVKEDKGSYYQYHYKTKPAGKDFLSQFSLDMPDITEQVDLLNEKSSRFLELVATMLYFADLPKAQVEAKVQDVKPNQKYSDGEMKEAWAFIGTLRQ